MEKYTPLSSLNTTIKAFLKGRIRFPKEFIGKTVDMNNGEKFTIFREVEIKKKEEVSTDKTLFIVQFQLRKMSVTINRLFSILPIPMFIGLPGFERKLWMCNEETGINQGVYQWETAKSAEHYSNSFAVRFMTKRSIPGSVKFRIIPNRDIKNFLEKSVQVI